MSKYAHDKLKCEQSGDAGNGRRNVRTEYTIQLLIEKVLELERKLIVAEQYRADISEWMKNAI
jgi:hypothetical protein